MWFKNLITFQLIERFSLDCEKLEAALKEFKFHSCLNSEPLSMGWSSPSQQVDGSLVHAVNGHMMICLRIEEKIVPASVVKEMLDEKVEELELKENRKIRKKEKDSLKDEVYFDLLPRAFTKNTYIYAYLDLKANLLIINAASMKKAELLTVQLRKALGSFKIQTPDIVPIPLLLTSWLAENEYPQDLVIEDSCVLKDPDDNSGTIRCQRQNLLSGEIAQLIENGREVVQLGLTWKDQISFVIKDDFSVRSVKFLEIIQDQANDIFTETEQDRFDADFSIMVESLHEFLIALFDFFTNEPLKLQSDIENEDLVKDQTDNIEIPFVAKEGLNSHGISDVK
ncbi:recombination-associated protein RdgC [Thiotrichales bacterium 19S11-10]|nr:recombination-associated protein RdgC [Thiotrichales bacterium 19S11-10]